MNQRLEAGRLTVYKVPAIVALRQMHEYLWIDSLKVTRLNQTTAKCWKESFSSELPWLIGICNVPALNATALGSVTVVHCLFLLPLLKQNLVHSTFIQAAGVLLRQGK